MIDPFSNIFLIHGREAESAFGLDIILEANPKANVNLTTLKSKLFERLSSQIQHHFVADYVYTIIASTPTSPLYGQLISRFSEQCLNPSIVTQLTPNYSPLQDYLNFQNINDRIVVTPSIVVERVQYLLKLSLNYDVITLT
ncbi:hypothetical protein J4455_03865 [Candidatus Woesearchaeota archaeon]|nr:hypothetical protein [Candidatus Woesearchaeota archaeon]